MTCLLNLRIGRLSRLLSAPNYSWCYRCKTTWAWVKPHHTHYSESRACFPLCEKCWAELTPEQRMPYYEELVAEWRQQHPVEPETVERIRAAVRAGE